MKKEVKDTIIVDLGEKLKEYPHFYLVDVTGMNIDYSELYGTLKGNTAVLFTHTANVPAKLLKDKDIAKAGVPSLKAAYAEEGFYVGADKLDELASIKSKNEVIADIVALLQSPAKNVVSALQSGASTIHGVLKTLGERPE